MARYKVVYEREKCIGAAGCVGVWPEKWKLAADGKADYLGTKEINEKDAEKMKQCAEACPVNAITVEEIKE